MEASAKLSKGLSASEVANSRLFFALILFLELILSAGSSL
jgi:hypothetical protein